MDVRRLGWMVPTVLCFVMACLVASAPQRTFAARTPEDELGPVLSRKVGEHAPRTWEATQWEAGYWRRMAYRAAHVERYRTELPDERPARRRTLYVSLLGESGQLVDGIRGRDVAARPGRVLLDIGSALFSRQGILDPVDPRDPLPIVLGMGEILRRRLRSRERTRIRWAKSG